MVSNGSNGHNGNGHSHSPWPDSWLQTQLNKRPAKNA